MARNVIYRWSVENDAGWEIAVYVYPANDFTDRSTNMLDGARVVKVPDEAIDWDSFPMLRPGSGRMRHARSVW